MTKEEKVAKLTGLQTEALNRAGECLEICISTKKEASWAPETAILYLDVFSLAEKEIERLLKPLPDAAKGQTWQEKDLINRTGGEV